MDVVHLQDITESSVDKGSDRRLNGAHGDRVAAAAVRPAPAVVDQYPPWYGRGADDGTAEPVKHMQRRTLTGRTGDWAMEQVDESVDQAVADPASLE